MASVMAPVTVGPTIWPMPKAMVITAIAFGQSCGE